jgi:hypothetical protein
MNTLSYSVPTPASPLVAELRKSGKEIFRDRKFSQSETLRYGDAISATNHAGGRMSLPSGPRQAWTV